MVRTRAIPTLYVMVKAPIAGGAKTRLASSIGSSDAMRFYRSITASLLRRVSRDARWRTVLAVTPDRHVASRFWPNNLLRVAQGGGDLGDRMQRLLDLPRGPNILIGSDIPGIRAAHIAEAFQVLSRRGIVFGPCEDGGFWLVGTRQCLVTPRPFRDVRWSTEHALADTLSNISRPVGFAAALADVDTEADWLQWRGGDLGLAQNESGH
jgi:rSAM/selenodomain-associated transferase 1